jgi:hypothetical protein
LACIGDVFIKYYNDASSYIDDNLLEFQSRSKMWEGLNALSLEVRQLIVDWWTHETIVSLDCKKIYKKRVGTKQIIEHPTYLLQVSQVSDLLFQL